MKFSLCGTMNMNWEEVSMHARAAEDLGFDQTYTSDHIATVASFDGDKGLLDAVGLLPALAVVTKKIRIGPLSSPFTFRDPAVLMRQLHTVDVLSGGRAMMGVGAGWDAEEHKIYDIPFPPIKERLANLDKACAFIHKHWANIAPKAPQALPPLRVAGASPSAMRTAIRYGEAITMMGSPGYVAEAIAKLRALHNDVPRTLPKPLEIAIRVTAVFTDNPDMVEWEKKRTATLAVPTQRAQANLSLPGESPGARNYVGPPEGFKEHLAKYAAIGVDRIILTSSKPFTIANLEKLARAAGV